MILEWHSVQSPVSPEKIAFSYDAVNLRLECAMQEAVRPRLFTLLLKPLRLQQPKVGYLVFGNPVTNDSNAHSTAEK